MGIATSQSKKYKVYTALLSQNGTGNNPTTTTNGLLTVGVTYQITSYQSGDDFTNVGAINNNNGTYFVATGTTPRQWGSASTLQYDTSAPFVNVFENTIGNITWFYDGVGNYYCKLNGVFINGKVFLNNQALHINIGGPYLVVMERADNDTLYITTNLFGGSPTDSILINNPIEIRIYN